MRYGRFVAALAAMATLLALSAAAATAVTYEPPIPYEPAPPSGKKPPPSSPPGPSQFCAGGATRNPSMPFKPLRKLPAPAANGRIGFGPAGVFLKPLPRLLTGAGPVGYTLSLRPSAPVAHLDWNVTTILSKVDRRGRFAGKLKRVRRHVSKLSRKEDADVRFRVGSRAAFYRVIAVFRDAAGQKLGTYGFYFRVVPPTQGAHLILDGDSYRHGETVVGRIDNPASETVFYGTPFAIERPQGSGWALAPESPQGDWTMPLYATSPGRTGQFCSRFRIPADMTPGRYRMSKQASVGKWPATNESMETLAAEFSVVP